MLTDAERDAIDRHAREVPDPKAACIEALRIVQRSRDGWVDDAALADVAAHLDLSRAELEGVATFYNLVYRRPVGRHVVLVCDSVSCCIRGSDAVLAGLRGRLGTRPGETTRDGRFTVLPMACLGACDHAPVVMVDEDTHRDVRPDALDDVLGRYP